MNAMPEQRPDANAVEQWLRDLQTRICDALEQADGTARFGRDEWSRAEGGGGVTRILENGALFERAGVGFSRVHGPRLPPSASAARPELAGRGFHAMGVSLVLHPRNPFVPTTHLNVRYLEISGSDSEFRRPPGSTGNDLPRKLESDPNISDPVWWFGGGYDLTPYYPFEDDAVHWHRSARSACDSVSDSIYPRLKKHCDEYFVLKHRGETRGVGGLFCDDWSEGGFGASFALIRAIGDSFLPAYLPIVERRRDTPFGERERDWQLVRRGRYVEFNLVWDRGTLFGLQSGGRTESILMSMPPEVRWRYDLKPDPGSPEAKLIDEFLRPRDWLADAIANSEFRAPHSK